MTDAYDIATRRFRDARAEYLRLKSELAAACAKMNDADRDLTVEWLKIQDAAEKRSLSLSQHQGN